MSKKHFWLVVGLGAGIGFLLGLKHGFNINPPFKGILQASSDVQGLTYYSWVLYSLIGTFIGAIGGFVVSAVLNMTIGLRSEKDLEE